MKQTTIHPFDNGPVSRIVLNNAIPSVVTMLMVLIYNLADTFFIGMTHNAYMVAASSLAAPAFTVFMAVGMIFGIGGTSLISRLMGMGKTETARHVSAFAFWTGLVIGIAGMIGMWLANDPVSVLLGASADTRGFVKDYLGIIAFGVPFLIVSNSFSSILRAEGKARKAMAGMILGNLVNILFNPLLILGFGLGIRGSAIATVIGNMAAALFYLMHFIQKKSQLSISLKDYQTGAGIATGVLAIGIPASLNSFLMSVSAITLNNIMLRHGDMAIAGMGVATRLSMVLAMVLIGIGAGVQPLFGYFFGAGHRQRFFETLRFTVILAVCTSLVMTAIVYFGSASMVRGFLQDPEAYGYGVEFIRILVFSGPVLGLLFVFNNVLQGMGAALPALVLSVSRQGLIYLPLLFLINTLFDSAHSLIAAQPVADYLAVGIGIALFLSVSSKHFGTGAETTDARRAEAS